MCFDLNLRKQVSGSFQYQHINSDSNSTSNGLKIQAVEVSDPASTWD